MKSFLKSSGDLIDKFALSSVNLMNYSDTSIEFPELKKVNEKIGINPELIYPIYKSSQAFSETSAINLYITSGDQFDSLEDFFKGIAIVEMVHLAKLGDFITAIGGKVNRHYNNDNVVYGTDPRDALNVAIESENETIVQYSAIFDYIVSLPYSEGKTEAIQFFNKLIADEKFHVSLFKQKLSSL